MPTQTHAAADVTNEGPTTSNWQCRLEAKANLALTQTEVVADAGYYNASEVSPCVEQRDHPVIPKGGHEREHGARPVWQKPVQYDAVKNEYVCPAGATLT